MSVMASLSNRKDDESMEYESMEYITETKDYGETNIDIDDIIKFGFFDGTVDSLNEMIAAFTFISPLTWTFMEKEEDGEIKSVLFFDKPKLLMLKEGVKCEKKDTVCYVNNGQGWFITKSEDDENIKTGITIFDEENFDIIMGKMMARELKYNLENAIS